MSDVMTLKAAKREVIGHANRKLAPQGIIPAVLYGAGREPMAIEVDRHEFEQYMVKHGAAGVLKIDLTGESKDVNAVIKDLQHAPVKGNITHVDFLAVRMDVAIGSTAPLNFVSDPVGVKEGGVLTIALHEVNIEAKPADLPESIEVDVEALAIGDNLTVGQIVPPAGVLLTDDPETVVCSVTAPTIEVEEEVEGEGEVEEMEPELIGESTDEEESTEE